MAIWSSLCVVLSFMARHAIRKDFKASTKKMVDNQAAWESVRGQK